MSQTFIYAILNSTNNTVKVGYSKNPRKRLTELQVATADPLELLFTFLGAFELEQQIHQQLTEYRLSGEWFLNCPQVFSVLNMYRRNQLFPITPHPATTPQTLRNIANQLLEVNPTFEDFCFAINKLENDFGVMVHLVAGAAKVYYEKKSTVSTESILSSMTKYVQTIYGEPA
jgi:hypothetical protein